MPDSLGEAGSIAAMDEEVDLLEFISTVAPVTHVRVAQGKITNGRSAFSLSRTSKSR